MSSLAAEHPSGLKKLETALRGRDVPVDVTLIERTALTHDTYKFRFAFPSADLILGLPTGQCVVVDIEDGKGKVTRPYTPVSTPDTKGHVDLVIKVYLPSERFPAGGRVTQFLHSLPINGKIKMRGPFGGLQYIGPPGQFEISTAETLQRLKITHLGLVAGGSGITPMYQMIQVLLLNASEPMKICLLFANKTVDDLILEHELNELRKMYPDRFDLTYIVGRKPEVSKKSDAEFYYGLVDENIMRRKLPPPGDDTLIALCGPPLMISQTCMPALEKLGHDKKRIHVF